MNEIPKKILLALIYAAVFATCSAVLLGFLGNLGIVFELLSHLRLIYSIILPILILIALICKLKKTVWITALFWVVNSVPILTLYLPTNQQSKSMSPAISVLQLNIRPYQNKEYDKVMNVITRRNADIVGVIELKKNWTERILTLKETYPYSFLEEGYGGIMILSKYPLSDSKIQYTGDIKRPRISTKVEKNKSTFSIILAHTVTPKNDLNFRNKELELLANEAKEADRPIIVFGDLNCSPFSFYFERLLKNGNLVDTEQGFGFQGTWPAYTFPFVSIDHVLVSDDLSCIKREVGPYIGSDHMPVYVELSTTK